MSSKAEQYAHQFETVNEEVIAAVTAASDEQWRQPCASEGWSVGVVAHHLSNAEHARDFAAVGKRETIDALHASGTAVLRQLRKLNETELDRTAGVFGGHEMSVSQVVDWVVIGHAAEHLQSLRATAADRAELTV